MNKTKIIVINGNGCSGKDTFVNFCLEINPNIHRISTVDFVKHLASLCGWDGTKTPGNRKFLSDLKDLLEGWDNVPNKIVENYIEYLDGTETPQTLFIHAREPNNIQYYKDKYNATAILILNDNVEQVTSNHADMGVYDFAYDYIIDNNGDLEQLKESAETFMKILN